MYFKEGGTEEGSTTLTSPVPVKGTHAQLAVRFSYFIPG